MASASLQPGTGLYDSSNEHDACGVGFVADLTGERRHDTVANALTVLRNLDHRGAKGADPESGDGAGILTQMPDELLRARCDFELPPAGLLRGRAWLPGRRTRQRQRAAGRGPADRRGGGPGRSSAGATFRTIPISAGTGPARCCPRLVQLIVTGLAGESGMELDRKAYCLRKRARARERAVPGQPRQRDDRLQGHADGAAAGGVLPRPVRPAVRLGDRAGARPLLHQHLPVLAAGAPVPADRPQRRDQHHPRQPELDARP